MAVSIFDKRYEFIRELAVGATAILYLARHRLGGRTCVVKLLDPMLSRSERFVTRLRREMKALHKLLAHPNIVRLLDMGLQADGRVFLVMDYIEGVTLASQLDDGPLPLSRTLRLATQIVDAVAHAHENGIVHRAIAPTSIMLEKRRGALSVVKILDFGW